MPGMIKPMTRSPAGAANRPRQDEEPGLGQDGPDEDRQHEPAPAEEDDAAGQELVGGQGQQGHGQRGGDAQRLARGKARNSPGR